MMTSRQRDKLQISIAATHSDDCDCPPPAGRGSTTPMPIQQYFISPKQSNPDVRLADIFGHSSQFSLEEIKLNHQVVAA